MSEIEASQPSSPAGKRSCCIPEPVPSFIEPHSHFNVKTDLDSCLIKMKQIFDEEHMDYEHKDNFCWRCECFVGSDLIKFYINIYRKSDNLFLIELQRRSGDFIPFSEFYQNFRYKFTGKPISPKIKPLPFNESSESPLKHLRKSKSVNDFDKQIIKSIANSDIPKEDFEKDTVTHLVDILESSKDPEIVHGISMILEKVNTGNIDSLVFFEPKGFSNSILKKLEENKHKGTRMILERLLINS
jgi:hypothetical protein